MNKRNPIGFFVGTIVALFLGIACFIMGDPYLAKADAADPVSSSGSLNVFYGDPRPGSKGIPSTVYRLTENSGLQRELIPSQERASLPGGLQSFNHKRVTVAGSTVSADGNRIQVDAIALEESIGSPLPSPAPMPAALTGSKPWVTILCRFADSPSVTPHDLPYFDGLMSNTYPGLDHYWREVSYDNISITGSVQVGWYNLPQPRSYYVYGGRLDFNRAANDCTAVADADVYFPNFIASI